MAMTSVAISRVTDERLYRLAEDVGLSKGKIADMLLTAVLDRLGSQLSEQFQELEAKKQELEAAFLTSLMGQLQGKDA